MRSQKYRSLYGGVIFSKSEAECYRIFFKHRLIGGCRHHEALFDLLGYRIEEWYCISLIVLFVLQGQMARVGPGKLLLPYLNNAVDDRK